MLSLGADADTAWRVIDTDEDLAPMADAARRSAAAMPSASSSTANP